MPNIASEPATTVRQRSPWLVPKLGYGVLFLAMAMAAYGWKLYGSRPARIEVPAQATAKVCIHNPDFAYQQAWQEIVAQAKPEIREKLRIEAQRTGQETVVAVSLSNLPAESIVPMANVVASAYSQACRAQWKLQLEQAYSAAQQKVRQADRDATEAQTLLELLRERRLRALASADRRRRRSPRRSRIHAGRPSRAIWPNWKSARGSCCSSARRRILRCRKPIC